MDSRRIMFAVASPGDVRSVEMEKAAALAPALNTELELFHCIFDEDVGREGRFGTRGVQEDIHGFVEERRRQLELSADELRARGTRVRTSIRWDDPTYEGIVRQVLRHEPVLLIAQSRWKSRMARALSTQSDYRLIETCPCPVLFIKTPRIYSDPLLVAAVDPEQSHGKPQSLDDRILDCATMLRDALGARLRVFHARAPRADAVRADPELRDVPNVETDDVYAAYRHNIESDLRELARGHQIPEEQVEIAEGYPAEALPLFVSREAADIVIMGAVARSALKRALVGHTAEKVLDTLDCDVLVVKPPEFCSPVSRQSAHHLERRAE